MFGNEPKVENKVMMAEAPQVAPMKVLGNYTDGIDPVRNLPATVPILNAQVGQKLSKARGVKDQMTISEFGTEAGKEVARLSDVILQRTTTGKMGEFGDGITQILALTSQVKVDDLNMDKNKGFLSKLIGSAKKKKVEVLAKFEDTSTSIGKVVSDLEKRQDAMRSDNKFLEDLYEKNLQEYHDLGNSIEAAQALLVEMNQDYAVQKAHAESSTDQFEIQAVNEFEQRIKLWEKQIDRLKRMQQIALLTAPEIRQIQTGNVAMVEKFNDLINTTIPAWKKQISLTIIKLKQKENAEIGSAMDDKTNEFFKKAADLNNMNAIAVAKASERSVVDVETLEYCQNKLIDSVKQVKQIQEAGRQERAAASTKIDQLREQMKTEMLSWSK
jgi:uncharacterized protein YaaN involved in tellurite resistance